MYVLFPSCSSSDNTHDLIDDLICWNDTTYYIHFSLGMVFLLLALITIYPVTALFYDDTCNPVNAFAKNSAQADVKGMLFRLLMTLCALLFNTPDNHVVISYTVVGLTFLTVYEYHSKARFYDGKMTRLWNAFQEILFCGALCNLLSILLNKYEFAGGVVLFMVLAVVVLAYEYFFGSGSIHILTYPVSQVVLGDMFDLYMKELSSLLIAKSIFFSA